MEVLMMIGRYAGEIRDIAPHYAHGMIERGEAIDPNAPIVSEVPGNSTFATGGVVPPMPQVVVGERVSDDWLPSSVAERLAFAALLPGEVLIDASKRRRRNGS